MWLTEELIRLYLESLQTLEPSLYVTCYEAIVGLWEAYCLLQEINAG